MALMSKDHGVIFQATPLSRLDRLDYTISYFKHHEKSSDTTLLFDPLNNLQRYRHLPFLEMVLCF